MVEAMASPRRQQAAAAAAAAAEDVLTVPLAREHSLHLHQADLAEMAVRGVPPSGAPVVVAVARTLLAVMAAHLVALAVLVAAGRRMTYPAHPEAMPVVAVAAVTIMATGERHRLAAAQVALELLLQMGRTEQQIQAAAAVAQAVRASQVVRKMAATAALAS